MLQLVLPVGIGDVKGLGEAVAEVVAGAALQGHAVVHHGLDGIGGLGPGELLLLGLLAHHRGDGQSLPVEVLVHLQNGEGELLGLLGGLVHGVALLPQKFRGAQEGPGGLFPAHHAAPLVVQLGQVPVGVDNLLIVLAEQSLAGGAHKQALGQLLAAALGDHGALGGKALHVVLFLLQQAFGDEHGHVHVLHAQLFKAPVQVRLHVFPQGIAVGLDDHAALHAGIVHQLGLFHHVGVPLGEVFLHGGDVLHHLFLLCHKKQVLSGRFRFFVHYIGMPRFLQGKTGVPL